MCAPINGDFFKTPKLILKQLPNFSIMGDSDDEYDRKRRDKFRGERGGDREGERERYPERER
jgi:hypothetical protein